MKTAIVHTKQKQIWGGPDLFGFGYDLFWFGPLVDPHRIHQLAVHVDQLSPERRRWTRRKAPRRRSGQVIGARDSGPRPFLPRSWVGDQEKGRHGNTSEFSKRGRQVFRDRGVSRSTEAVLMRSGPSTYLSDGSNHRGTRLLSMWDTAGQRWVLESCW